MKPWIGVDLDGTLAEHYWPEQGPYEHTRIGAPVPAMVDRVKRWIAQGKEVRIFTARVGPQPENRARESEVAIRLWCLQHLGADLQVTATKDYGMVSLFDDRAVRIVMNTGEPCCDEGVPA